MALLCVDTSGSMAGGRIQAATSGMHTLVQALKPRDVLGVYKFNTTVDVLQTFVRNHKIDWQAHIAGLNAAPSGSTALHDAIMQSMDALQKYAKPKHDDTQLRVVVVLTDGDDNASKTHTLDTVIQRVHSSTIANFHFMLLGVGVDASKYAALFPHDKPNLHYIDVKDATHDAIRDAFGTVTKKITALQQKLIVRTTTTTTTTATSASTSGVVHAAPAVRMQIQRQPQLQVQSSTPSRPRIQVIQR
jgi:uncharacterized protein YegL